MDNITRKFAFKVSNILVEGQNMLRGLSIIVFHAKENINEHMGSIERQFASGFLGDSTFL